MADNVHICRVRAGADKHLRRSAGRLTPEEGAGEGFPCGEARRIAGPALATRGAGVGVGLEMLKLRDLRHPVSSHENKLVG